MLGAEGLSCLTSTELIAVHLHSLAAARYFSIWFLHRPYGGLALHLDMICPLYLYSGYVGFYPRHFLEIWGDDLIDCPDDELRMLVVLPSLFIIVLAFRLIYHHSD